MEIGSYSEGGSSGSGEKKQSDETDVEMGGDTIGNSDNPVEKREREEEGESRASKAVRTYQPKSRREKKMQSWNSLRGR